MTGRLICGAGRLAPTTAILMLAAVMVHAGARLGHSGGGVATSSHRKLLAVVQCQMLHVTYHPSTLEVEWTANAREWGTNDTTSDDFCKHIKPAARDIKAGLALIKDLMSPTGKRNVLLSESKYLSHFTYTLDCGGVNHSHHMPIEPLIGSLRHPMFPCDGSPSDLHRIEHLLEKSYLLLSSVYAAPWLFDLQTRVLVFDLGASTYDQGGGGASQQWFVETLLARGLEVDEYYGWEIKTYNVSAVYDRVPDWLLPRYHWYNRPAPTGRDDSANPLNILKRVAKPQDYVLFKLDIDMNAVEMEFMRMVLDDPAVASLIDELFFEHHVWLWFMNSSWNDGTLNGSLHDSYQIFSQLRHMGIRAHGWV